MLILNLVKVVAMKAKLSKIVFKLEAFLSQIGAGPGGVVSGYQGIESLNCQFPFQSHALIPNLLPFLLWCLKTGHLQGAAYWFL